ncbi:hypothetical protein [Tardiphaga sp. P9-11]|nr:hypothetical protein [Tardiphaga sp. P9-11]
MIAVDAHVVLSPASQVAVSAPRAFLSDNPIALPLASRMRLSMD